VRDQASIHRVNWRNYALVCWTALAIAGTLAAQTAEPAAGHSQICAEFVSNKLSVWQQRLKLDDWRISVVTARRSDLKARTLGGIRWDKHKKTAVISVLDPSEYRASLDEILRDLGFTIVHELVHLELASLPRSEASRRTEEHAVNRIAEALLALDRR
jgi:hypothetical protein